MSTKRTKADDEGAIVSKKLRVIDDDHVQLAQALVDKVSQLQQQAPDEANNLNTQHEKIENARLEIRELGMVKASLDHAYSKLMKKKAAAVLGLIDDGLSPLLSLQKGVHANIVSFLDEEGLLAFEESSKKIDRELTMVQWTSLDELRPQLGKSSSALGPRERGVRFSKASDFARRMEHAAQIHYNSSTVCEEWPEELYTLEDYFSDFFNGGEEVCEIFVRLSTRSSPSPAWEGFIGFNGSCRIEELTPAYMDAYLGPEVYGRMNWTEVNRFREQLLNEDKNEEWPESLRMTCLESLLVTMVVYCGDLQSPTKLIVATGGYFGSKDGFGMLQSRNIVAKEKTPNLEDCVNVGMYVDADSFNLVVGRGAYESSFFD